MGVPSLAPPGLLSSDADYQKKSNVIKSRVAFNDYKKNRIVIGFMVDDSNRLGGISSLEPLMSTEAGDALCPRGLPLIIIIIHNNDNTNYSYINVALFLNLKVLYIRPTRVQTTSAGGKPAGSQFPASSDCLQTFIFMFCKPQHLI